MTRQRWLVAGLIAALSLPVVVALSVVIHWNVYVRAPIAGLEDAPPFEVSEGQGWSATLDALEEAGLVTRRLYFRVLIKLRDKGQRLRPGRYVVPEGTTPEGLLARLTRSGPGGSVRLVVPEGFSMYHIADRVAADELVTRQAFLDAATDKALMKALGVSGPSLEGHLFPDTYFFDPGTPASAMVKRMVHRHRRVWREVLKEVGDEQVVALKKVHGLSDRELVTLASIVEKEAVVADEQPIIARVFYNRLAKGMKLQTDPTCVYGPVHYRSKPSPTLCRDKRRRYSTYVIEGLPPGPIANPGREAMRAVLTPTTKASEKDYLFFVAKPGGRRHTFSKTYKAHRKAVRQR